jgi:cobyrinic acid a,c-diamide synthase
MAHPLVPGMEKVYRCDLQGKPTGTVSAAKQKTAGSPSESRCDDHALPQNHYRRLKRRFGQDHITSLGLVRCWVRLGKAVKPFKKDPDYIDAKWLSLAAGVPGTNLDPYLLRKPVLRSLFCTSAAPYEGALIEGNRGIFDGKDLHGSTSTAELVRIIDAPVVVVIDSTKMTRTAAALIRGVMDFEPDLRIAGVILNRIANDRHRAILCDAVEHYTGLPVLGARSHRNGRKSLSSRRIGHPGA